MAAELSEAVAALRLDADDVPAEFRIDDILFAEPRAAALRQGHDATPGPDELKSRLERKYLFPDKTFSPEWLDKLQQRMSTPVDYSSLLSLAPTQTRTATRFQRHGLEGRVTGYTNVTLPAGGATAKNSTSFLRKPASRVDFVRGAAGFFPFAPGGLEGVESVAALEEQAHAAAEGGRSGGGQGGSAEKLNRVITLGRDGGLLEVAPGLERGIRFKKAQGKAEETEAKAVEDTLQEEPEPATAGGADADEGAAPTGGTPDEEADEDEDGLEDIDAILPVEFPALEPHGTLAASTARRAGAGGREWAHMVDINREMTNFAELVPDMARTWPFELDTFQKEAVYHLENGDSVFVAAHTSAGKTVVAEYAIALAARHRTKAIYTSPIKALSNQKFRDFRTTFDDVGILTGDVQINPEASCVIMTTEILRSMLYRGADLIRDVQYVIFDEVHYVNDFERGVVWEEVIIMLPEQVSLILLSATVPNTYEFASWVGRTKKKDIYVISTPKRPVPLEHYLWAGKEMHKIVDAEKKFLEKGWKEAQGAMQGKDKLPPPPQFAGNATARGAMQRGGPRGGGGNMRGGPGQRGGGPQQRGGRGGGGPPRASHAPGHMGRGGGRAGGYTSLNQDRNLWVHLVGHLRKFDLLPACIFVFSKKRVEENASALSNQDYLPSQSDKSRVHVVVEKSLARLRSEDRVLPQIVRLRELLSRGIAVHHGGLLPIVKELVEILFAQTLVKVLFATETFAMGLNLPTRTVVFSGYRKHDGHSFRNLLPGEYTQMAGRAGRRGLDTVGTVVVVPPGSSDDVPPAAELRGMILGEPSKLRSQFRLTYNMILNLLRVEALKIEEMIRRSFSEHATQQLLPEHERAVRVGEADLARVKRDACDVCDKPVDFKQAAGDGKSTEDGDVVGAMDALHDAAQTYSRLTTELYEGLLKIPIGRKMFTAGRVVVYSKDGDGGVRTAGILLSEGATLGSAKAKSKLAPGEDSASAAAAANQLTLHVCEFRVWREARDDTDLLPFVPALRQYFTQMPANPAGLANNGGGKKKRGGGNAQTPTTEPPQDTAGGTTQGNFVVATKTLHVPLADIQCLTKQVITKGIVPEIFQGGDAYHAAKSKIADMCRSWMPDRFWDEMDLARIKSLPLQEIISKRKQAETVVARSPALGWCPQFVKHFAMCHDQYLIKSHISSLRQALSDQNLQLLPDYEQRVLVLRDLGFIDAPHSHLPFDEVEDRTSTPPPAAADISSTARIQLKGKVACEIHSGDELVLTELILDNVLAEFEPAEIAALLSAFVFQEKSGSDGSPPTITPRLEKGIKAIVAIADKVNAVQERHQVITQGGSVGDTEAQGGGAGGGDFASRPRFGLVEVVYEWARGMSFKNITDLTDVLEGTIVRTISRLDETCREVKNAARIIGDPDLYAKMERAQELIKRDITAVASLYM